MEEIKQFLLATPPRWRTRRLQKIPEYLAWFATQYPCVAINIAIDAFLKDISPYCKVCNSPVNSPGKLTCSVKCRVKTTDYTAQTEKRKKSMLKKYGVDNPAKLSKVQEKRINTNIQKYGGKVSQKTRDQASARAGELNSKGKETIKQRHGVINAGQIDGHRDKCRTTLLKNYGVDIYFNSQEFKSKQITQSISKYNSLAGDDVDVVNVSDYTGQIEFKNPNQRILYNCSRCGNQETIATETFKWRQRELGDICRWCSKILNGSKAENDIRSFVQSLGFITLDNNKLLGRQEIDIFIPQKNVGIEYNGLYWHNSLRINNNYHKEKSEMAISKGIRLIHVFEDEWINSRAIVESRIKAILGQTDNVVYARKCQVKEITSKATNLFLKDNHLQGSGRSSVRLGLFFDNQLVSVMTFLLGDISKNLKGWELNRFCSLVNYRVTGGASKLFRHFTKFYSPDQITSFADRRWSEAHSVYEKLGFTFTYNTRPNYWYFRSNEIKRYHRYKLRKPTNTVMTEKNLRLSQGWLRIYDCGSSKWVWSREKAV